MGGEVAKSSVVKRSLILAGHRTSVSLEDAFWDALKDVAASSHRSVSAIIADLDRTRPPDKGLSSTIRVFVLGSLRDELSALRRATQLDIAR